MLKFIELENKRPKNSLDIFSTTHEKMFDAGLLLTNNIVVVDFDGDNENEINIINYFLQRYPTFNVKTNKGYHLYYKKPKEIKIKPVADKITVGGFQVDYKTGTKSYVKIKENGKLREMSDELTDKNLKKLPMLPELLYPMNRCKNNLSGLGDGDGRNNDLFYHLRCVKETYSNINFADVGVFINEKIFKDKFDNKELENLINSVGKLENTDHYTGDPSDMIAFAEYLVKTLDIKSYKTRLYFRHNNRFISDNKLLLRKVTEFLKLKKSQDMELLHQINKFSIDIDKEYKKFYIQLNNALIDNGDILPINDIVFTPFYLDVKYEPNAYDENVDKFLNDISCNRIEIRKTLEEILGHVLLINKFPAKVFFLLGNGKNGKSTFLEMINNFAGELSSNIGLNEFNDDTSVCSLIGKLVNCSDEVDADYIDKAKRYKSMASGNTITARPIYSQPIKFNNTATLILNANKMPTFKDKTDGFFRRLMIIPFDYDLKVKHMPDENMDEKLSTDNAKSYILNLALNGIKRIKANGYKMTENKFIDETINNYILDTDSVASYLNEFPDVHNNTTESVYDAYTFYCEDSGFMALNKSNFTKRLKDFGYKSDTRKGKRCYLKIDLIGKQH